MIYLNRTTGQQSIAQNDHNKAFVQLPTVAHISTNPLHAGMLAQKLLYYIGQVNIRLPVKH